MKNNKGHDIFIGLLLVLIVAGLIINITLMMLPVTKCVSEKEWDSISVNMRYEDAKKTFGAESRKEAVTYNEQEAYLYSWPSDLQDGQKTVHLLCIDDYIIQKIESGTDEFADDVKESNERLLQAHIGIGVEVILILAVVLESIRNARVNSKDRKYANVLILAAQMENRGYPDLAAELYEECLSSIKNKRLRKKAEEGLQHVRESEPKG